ncbi:SsgA family sporulation/cell division regulator [Nakamurella silvestris]|nr:SsgA family sporulation/cell division regulator [Nakamurella silvestris]
MNGQYPLTHSDTLRARIDLTLTEDLDSPGYRRDLASVDDELPPEVVHAVLNYRMLDPYAIGITFSYGDCPGVDWVCARDLFRGGLTEPTGSGDVRIRPAGDRIVIELLSPTGYASLSADRGEIADFVDRMYRAVPDGSENAWFFLDQELQLLS